MKRHIASTIAVVMALCLVLSCSNAKTTSQIPTVPAEVVSVWKLLPSPQGFPPSISKQVTLSEYGSENDVVRESIGSFAKDQWVDIIVKSIGTPVLFGTTNAGFISVGIEDFGPSPIDGLWRFGSSVAEAGGIPSLSGKFLYMPDGYMVTKTGDNETYITAYRYFIEISEPQREEQILFQNLNPSKSAQITFEVYPLTVTPGWSNYFHDTLEPWLNSFAKEDEYQDALARWMEQFN